MTNFNPTNNRTTVVVELGPKGTGWGGFRTIGRINGNCRRLIWCRTRDQAESNARAWVAGAFQPNMAEV